MARFGIPSPLLPRMDHVFNGGEAIAFLSLLLFAARVFWIGHPVSQAAIFR